MRLFAEEKWLSEFAAADSGGANDIEIYFITSSIYFIIQQVLLEAIRAKYYKNSWKF